MPEAQATARRMAMAAAVAATRSAGVAADILIQRFPGGRSELLTGIVDLIDYTSTMSVP